MEMAESTCYWHSLMVSLSLIVIESELTPREFLLFGPKCLIFGQEARLFLLDSFSENDCSRFL